MTTSWTGRQKHTVHACFLSWMFDAFDFFILVFLFSSIAKYFHVSLVTVSFSVMLTLIFRPLGAFLFGILATKYDKKFILILNVFCFAILEILTALSHSVLMFLVVRSLYGIAMGGIWGVASTLAFENTPDKSRGMVSGIFQAGYPAGYLIASIVFGLTNTMLHWQGMFLLAGIIPIMILVPYIYLAVPSSANAAKNKITSRTEKLNIKTLTSIIKEHWKVCVFMVVLMTCFNFFSHGTQDLYPTFLQTQHHFSDDTVSIIAIFYNIASIIGGITLGSLSQKLGRKKTIGIAACLAIFVVPLWAFSSTALILGIGSFLMQFLVQGAWGIVPTYLHEITPSGTQAIIPGIVYQLGNLFASINSPIQSGIAKALNGNYGISLASVLITVSITLILLMIFANYFKLDK